MNAFDCSSNAFPVSLGGMTLKGKVKKESRCKLEPRGCAGTQEIRIHSIPRLRRNTRNTHTFYTAVAQEQKKYAYILYRGCAGTQEIRIHSIPRLRRNTRNTHTFYTAVAQEHRKYAYILYRGCAGISQFWTVGAKLQKITLLNYKFISKLVSKWRWIFSGNFCGLPGLAWLALGLA